MSQLVLHTQFQNTICKMENFRNGPKILGQHTTFQVIFVQQVFIIFLRDWPKGLDLMCSPKHTQTILSDVSYEISFLKLELSILLQACLLFQ